MTQTQKRLTVMFLLLSITIFAGLSAFIATNSATAHADTVGEEDEPTPLGLYTKITLGMDAIYNGNTVLAEARNDFTFGFAQVYVIVQLYSYPIKRESCDMMDFENQNSIADLNIYKSISVEAQINGVARYWRSRVEYRMDKNDWKYHESETLYILEDGRIMR